MYSLICDGLTIIIRNEETGAYTDKIPIASLFVERVGMDFTGKDVFSLQAIAVLHRIKED